MQILYYVVKHYYLWLYLHIAITKLKKIWIQFKVLKTIVGNGRIRIINMREFKYSYCVRNFISRAKFSHSSEHYEFPKEK